MKMTKAKKTRLAAALALLIAPALAAAQADPYDLQSNSEGRDAYREGLIWGTYVANPALNAYRLGVDVQGNRAILTGRVESPVDKLLAERIAMRAQGVTQVDNRIQVDPLLIVMVEPVRIGSGPGDNANSGAVTSSGRVDGGGAQRDADAGADRADADGHAMAGHSDYSRGVADDTLAAMVNSRLLWSPDTDGTDIQVSARDGVVTLTGRADNEAARNKATQLAQGTRGVVRVDNRLTVESRGQVVQAEAGEGDDAMSDTWVTAKVNSSFAWSAGVDAASIDVETRDGRVTLSGTADSAAAKRQAVELASSVRGVKSVDASKLQVVSGAMSQR